MPRLAWPLKPEEPKTQTSLGPITATDVVSPAWDQAWATVHRAPFQRSAYPSPTAQTSPGDESAAAAMKPPSPAGRDHACQRLPFQCSAAGELVPPGLVPPNTQASSLAGAMTAE